jgi:rod shape-determining protein MreD
MGRHSSPVASLLPMVTTCVAVLLSLQPVHLPGYARVAPAFALMAVYHWTLYRPDLLPPLALFVIGVVGDSLTGDHLGITALFFLISRAVVLRCRRRIFNRTFPYILGKICDLNDKHDDRTVDNGDGLGISSRWGRKLNYARGVDDFDIPGCKLCYRADTTGLA